uniref:Transpeptidase domain-containing protein n=1 Tax=Rhodnius prolixus TaxID=13249 RepID=T1I4M7_RHOPR
MVVIIDPRDGGLRALVSTPSYYPNLFVDGISSINYRALLNDPNKPLINRATQGLYPPASTVKPYIAASALSANVITPTTSLFDPGWWQLPGSEKRFRDWKKWGHGRLNVTKSLEESADTFFYQVAYDMGIDRLAEWMNKFGYGEYTGIDLAEERSGNMPTREWKQKRFKRPWYQGDTIPVGIGQGYWIATPIQMAKALTTLINDGNVKTPHLFYSARNSGVIVPYRQQEVSRLSDVRASYWEIAKDGMYGVANRQNGTAHKFFADAPYKIAAKTGTAQVFGLKENETYNAHKIAEHLRDHKLLTAFSPYNNPKIAISIVLENGGAGPAISALVRQMLDHIMLGDNNTELPDAPPSAPGSESE